MPRGLWRSGPVRLISAAPVALMLLATLLTACKAPEAPVPPPPEVNALTLVESSLPLELSYTARTRGEREVQVRARVSGILEKRYYVEGSTIAAGALMFRIDPQPFAAALRSAEGRLGVQRAQWVESEQQVKRITPLFAAGVVTQRDRDLAEAAYASAKAAVAAATAEVESAKLNLAYTEVRAPIAGITGREARSEGSLINAQTESSLLTTIAQSDRLYVDFAMPEAEARLVRAALAKGPDTVKLRLQASAGEPLPDTARIEFIDASVDGDSGTVPVRATLRNAESRLAPGQFVRAKLEGLDSGIGLFLPARAVLYGADGAFVWKLDDKDVVQFAPVHLSPGSGNLLRVDQGLAVGDRVIVDGVLKVAPQASVTATAVTLEALPAAVASGP